MNIQSPPLADYQEITVIGKYENIWLVYHQASGKVYVKKCLEVFNRKVYEWLKTVSNPHIPRIILCEEMDGKLYVIEEYISGETLEERLERVNCLPEKDALPLLFGLAQVLDFLHSQNPPVIHRDVKLSNVMVSYDGMVKLIDYNAARYYGLGMVRDTALIGTVGYAAPEQFGFGQTDERSDIYAFGVVMNYLLTGAHVRLCPYQGKLGKVIRTCTHIDPERRFQNMEEVKAALIKNSSCLMNRERELFELFSEDWQKNSDRKNIRQRLWPVPGFRSRKIWKMVVAVLGYLFIYNFVAHIEVKTSPGGIWLRVEQICLGISLLFFVALVTDYGEMSRSIPFIRHKNIFIRMCACGIFGFLGLCAMICFFLLLEMIFGV